MVALIDEEEATLKRFRRRGASIALEPANAAYEVRILPPNRVRIQGKLIGLSASTEHDRRERSIVRLKIAQSAGVGVDQYRSRSDIRLRGGAGLLASSSCNCGRPSAVHAAVGRE